jgi:hypothetical protein
MLASSEPGFRIEMSLVAGVLTTLRHFDGRRGAGGDPEIKMS